MALRQKIVALCTLLALSVPLEVFAGKASLRHHQPRVVAVAAPEHVLVASSDVDRVFADSAKEQSERPGLLSHLSHFKKPEAPLETEISEEALEMEGADKMAEEVVKETLSDKANLQDDDSSSTELPSDLPVVGTMAHELTEEVKVVKDPKPSKYHEKMSQKLEHVKDAYKTAQAEAEKLQPQVIGAAVKKLQDKSKDRTASSSGMETGDSLDEDDRLYFWAKSEADKIRNTSANSNNLGSKSLGAASVTDSESKGDISKSEGHKSQSRKSSDGIAATIADKADSGSDSDALEDAEQLAKTQDVQEQANLKSEDGGDSDQSSDDIADKVDAQVSTAVAKKAGTEKAYIGDDDVSSTTDSKETSSVQDAPLKKEQHETNTQSEAKPESATMEKLHDSLEAGAAEGGTASGSEMAIGASDIAKPQESQDKAAQVPIVAQKAMPPQGSTVGEGSKPKETPKSKTVEVASAVNDEVAALAKHESDADKESDKAVEEADEVAQDDVAVTAQAKVQSSEGTTVSTKEGAKKVAKETNDVAQEKTVETGGAKADQKAGQASQDEVAQDDTVETAEVKTDKTAGQASEEDAEKGWIDSDGANEHHLDEEEEEGVGWSDEELAEQEEEEEAQSDHEDRDMDLEVSEEGSEEEMEDETEAGLLQMSPVYRRLLRHK